MSNPVSASEEWQLEYPEVGRKGGEADGGEVVETEVSVEPTAAVEDGGEATDGGSAASSFAPVKVLDREYKTVEEMAAEIERQQKILTDPNRLRAHTERVFRGANAAPAAPTNSRTENQPSGAEQGDSFDPDLARKQLNDLGYLDKNQVESRLARMELNHQLDRFCEKKDGADGLPKADKLEMLEYIDANGLYALPLTKVYKLMNEEAIEAHMAKQVLEKTPKPMTSERSAQGSGRTAKADVKPIRYNDREGRQQRRAEIFARHRGTNT